MNSKHICRIYYLNLIILSLFLFVPTIHTHAHTHTLTHTQSGVRVAVGVAGVKAVVPQRECSDVERDPAGGWGCGH